jgi:hypothetical protein
VRFSRKPLSFAGSHVESSAYQARNELDQANQAEFLDQPTSGITTPHIIPPTFGKKRIQTSDNPPIQLMEETANMGLGVIGTPAPDHRVDPIDYLNQSQG